MEQYARDVKIVSIWEGTNYIQSLDLIGRKLPMEGRGGVPVLDPEYLRPSTKEHKEDPDFAPDFKLLFKAAQATGRLRHALHAIFPGGETEAYPLGGHPLSGMFFRGAHGAYDVRAGDDRPGEAERRGGRLRPTATSIEGKIETVKYFCRNILTNVFSRHTSFQQEDTSAVDIPEEGF